jgi:Flp pilus assembly protein TadG
MGRTVSGSRHSRRRGQALTEFALVMPILLLLVLGIMEFGRAWFQSQVITDAARQGARTAAILHGNVSSGEARDSAETIVRTALAAARIDPDEAAINIQGTGAASESATATVSLEFDFGVFASLMQFLGESFNGGNGTITLRSRAIMRNE